MRHAPRLQSLSWKADPMQVAAAWPVDRPLFMLHSGRVHERWARWSVLASPVAVFRFDGRSSIDSGASPPVEFDVSHDPLHDLDRLLAATRRAVPAAHASSVPFAGGWIGYLSYDLGRLIEPAAVGASAAPAGRQWPLMELAWCPDALVFDHLSGQWHEVGRVPGLEAMESCVTRRPACEPPAFEVGTLRSSLDPDAYLAAVSRTIEYIAAGEIFQANITQRFTAPFHGSTRSLFHAAMAAGAAWYGAYLEFGDAPAGELRRLISLSPELFLELDPRSRTVITRPVKGTRPISADPDELQDSAKDEAELNMIIDLMRNDLGRVCEFGTVRVTEPRMIETHPTVHHGVGEICGRLREEATIGRLLAASFPGGSVTGAPKIRAMQIIDELESTRRGPYCGAVGYFSDCGRMCLNVAIRTLTITAPGSDTESATESTAASAASGDAIRGVLDYGAGGGIVADSDLIAEYRECMDKTEVLRQSLPRPATATAGP